MCNSSCFNQSWISSSNLLASWSFDNTFIDQTYTYNATPLNSPSFVSNGYLNQAVYFNANLNQSLTAKHVPLANTSFTISVWLYPMGYPNSLDHSILGLCPAFSPNYCLHLTLRRSGSGCRIYFGFYFNDCSGVTYISLNNWVYVTFVFDLSSMNQWIYLNGVLECNTVVSSPLLALTGNLTIGLIPGIDGSSATDYFQVF